MKRTDKERIERTLKRSQKQEANTQRKVDGRKDLTPGSYTKTLVDLLQYDDDNIYNIDEDEDVLELMLEMKDDLPESKWDIVIKKAVKTTKVSNKDDAILSLRALLDD